MKQILELAIFLIIPLIKGLNLKSLYKNTLVLLKALLIFLDGFMPPHLSEALKNKNFHNVHSLLNKRVKPIPVDIRSKEFKTGLMLACFNKDPKMVEMFLNKGAKLELTDVDDGWTALHYASQSGCHESVKQLIDKGANIEAITNKRVQTLKQKLIRIKQHFTWQQNSIMSALWNVWLRKTVK
jgi:hypothetical protein